MDAMTCILERRSVRHFTDEPVAAKDLERIFEGVRFAPSWANTQCVSLVKVADPAVKSKLQATVPKGNPAHRAILEAPVVIALCAQREVAGVYEGEHATVYGDWMLFDAGIAAQNLALAAHALGYSTVNVGLLDHEKAADVLGLPEEVALLELLPLGRAARVGKAPKRKPLSELVHEETW
jgi:nitroreductase